MYIESISFSKKPIDGVGWEIKECSFNKINLIAGQNSAGKTRLINAIYDLVKLLSDNNARYREGFNLSWEISLKGREKDYNYILEIEDKKVIFEQLLVDNKQYFQRDKSGKGKISYESSEILELDFEIEHDKIVLNSKRDKTQHPTLETLFKWANSVYLYNFGDKLGRTSLMNPKLNIDENEFFKQIGKDDEAVIFKFEKGLKEYDNRFKEEIINDFNSIGYNIEDINTTKLNEFVKNLPDEILTSIPSTIYIKEKNIKDKIFQYDISQGMFRVLSLIIQIKYLEYQLASDTTIIIDDIGEGLDYKRATKLIKYIIKKSKHFEDKIQLIMTTNDRFTMNNVPLEYWTIINKKDNGQIEFYSQKTHKECFEDFEDIGLNNFDFFTGEYYKNCIGQK